jgi:hypothetical protein
MFRRIFIALLLFAIAKPASADLLTDLVAAWKLDEASGNAIDIHDDNDLADTNTVTAGTGLVYATARDFEFDDTEHFTLADNTDLSTGDIAFSIAIWFKPESVAGFPGLLNKYATSAGQREYTVYINAGDTEVKFQYSSDGTAESIVSTDSAAITAGNWYLVIIDHDPTGNETGIQLNNGTRKTASYSAGIFDGTSPFEIGTLQTGSFPFDGLIGPVYFWKRALTTDERTALYNGGAGKTYASFGQSQAPRSIHQYRQRTTLRLPRHPLATIRDQYANAP